MQEYKTKKYIPYSPGLLEKARQNRKNPTLAEKTLWYKALCAKQFGNYKFLRQKPLINYIADFYCAKLLLVIEIDGDTHAEQADYDFQRTKKLSDYKIKVIRYTNKEILDNIEGVYLDLIKRIKEREISLGLNSIKMQPPLTPPYQGENQKSNE